MEFESSYLRISGVKCGGNRDLIFSAGCHMKGSLSNDWHIQVMDNGHFEAFGAFVIVTVVIGFDVKKHGESIIFARFGPFLHATEPPSPIGIGSCN